MPSDYVSNLQKAIRAMHHCNSRYIESVPVTQTVEGKIAWAGVVDVFDLIWHPTAKRAYAWSYRDGVQTKSFAVLEAPPVNSPQSAVKIAIAAMGRRPSIKTAGIHEIRTMPSPRDIFWTLFGNCVRWLNSDGRLMP